MAPLRDWVAPRLEVPPWVPLLPAPAGVSASPERPVAAWSPLSDSSSSRSHSASGSSSAGLAEITAAPSLPAASDA